MADERISESAELTAGNIAAGDLIPIVDVSEAADEDKNKHIRADSLPGFLTLTGTVTRTLATSGGDFTSLTDFFTWLEATQFRDAEVTLNVSAGTYDLATGTRVISASKGLKKLSIIGVNKTTCIVDVDTTGDDYLPVFQVFSGWMYVQHVTFNNAAGIPYLFEGSNGSRIQLNHVNVNDFDYPFWVVEGWLYFSNVAIVGPSAGAEWALVDVEVGAVFEAFSSTINNQDDSQGIGIYAYASARVTASTLTISNAETALFFDLGATFHAQGTITLTSNANDANIPLNEVQGDGTYIATGTLLVGTLSAVVDDTTPVLGGELECDGNKITDTHLRLNGATSAGFQIADTNAILCTATQFYPAVDSTWSLGTNSFRWTNVFTDGLNTSGSLYFSDTVSVAGLPSAATDGQIYKIDDALSPVNGAVVTGGGSVRVLVYSDGTNWRVLIGGATPTDADAIHDNVSGEINAITEKSTPVSGDWLLIEDSADSNAKKKVQVGNLPSGGAGGLTPVIEDDDYTASANEHVFFRTATAAAAKQVDLPATPSDGDVVWVWDCEDSATDYNVTVDGNGNDIANTDGDNFVVLNVSGGKMEFVWNDTDSQWEFTYTTPGAAGFTGKQRWFLKSDVELKRGGGAPTLSVGVQIGTNAWDDVFVFNNTQDISIYFTTAMPPRWNKGTMRARFYWMPSSTNTGVCRWRAISTVPVAEGTAPAATTVTHASVDDTAIGTANVLQISDWTAELTFTSASDNKLLTIVFQREGNHANDTFTGNATLIGIELEWTADSPTDD